MQISLPKNYEGIVEQLIRPTGLIDPPVDVRPGIAAHIEQLKKNAQEYGYKYFSIFDKEYRPVNQVDDLLNEIKITVSNKERVLVTTLTKRMAEELTGFMKELNIAVQYIHSDVDTIERVEILRDLRLGKYDVVVGINLLREGLDLPEVSLVAILDADKEGFLRSHVSLIQTIGRAARHINGRVIMYADRITQSMKNAIDETNRRRQIQMDFNKANNIKPETIIKEIKDNLTRIDEENSNEDKTLEGLDKKSSTFKIMSKKEQKEYRAELELQMRIYADMLEFEKAAKIRDILDDIKR